MDPSEKGIMSKILMLSVVSMVVFSGCASIICGARKDVRITSSPEAASVVIYDRNEMKVWEASTPTVASLKRGNGFFRGASYRVEISADDFETQAIHIKPVLNGWYFGNLLLGGLIGMVIVDPISGAMWTLSPDETNIALTEDLSFDRNGDADRIHVVLRKQIPDDVFNTLKLVRLN